MLLAMADALYLTTMHQGSMQGGAQEVSACVTGRPAVSREVFMAFPSVSLMSVQGHCSCQFGDKGCKARGRSLSGSHSCRHLKDMALPWKQCDAPIVRHSAGNRRTGN